MWYIRREMKRVSREGGTYTTNEQIARRVYRALKTPSDSAHSSKPLIPGIVTSMMTSEIALRCCSSSRRPVDAFAARTTL